MRWYASKRRKEESSDNVWKSRLTEPYLWCCQAVHSRPSDLQQRGPDSCRSGRPDGRWMMFLLFILWN